MSDLQWTGITLQQIRIFLTVARLQNISRAAEELFLTQPTISRNIAALEELLGITLFFREKKRIRLTPAGIFLSEQFSRQLNDIQTSIATAVTIQDQSKAELYIGNWSAGDPSLYLYPYLAFFEKQNPYVRIHIENLELKPLLDSFRKRKLDIVFLPSVIKNEYKNASFMSMPVFKNDPFLIISRYHHLYRKNDLSYTDLMKDVALLSEGELYDLYSQQVETILDEIAFSGERTYCMEKTPQEFTTRLYRDNCFAFSWSAFNPQGRDSFRAIPLPDTLSQSMTVDAVWNSENLNPYLEGFVSCLRRKR